MTLARDERQNFELVIDMTCERSIVNDVTAITLF